jgi:transcriptional regulator with XRE-family HTH domain
MINIDPGVIEYRLLTDPELAAIVLQLRKDRGWTQETLAELARVSPRTIQRLEDGQPSSSETRRAVAAAFEYGDLDTFNKPWPLPNIEKLKEESARIESETVAINVQSMARGKQLRELAEQAHSFLITSIDDPADEVEAMMASLKGYFVEYGNCHDLYSATDKLEVNQHFQEQIDALQALGVGVVGGRRSVRMRFENAEPDHTGVALDIAYVVSGPLTSMPQTIRVPRKDRFGF